MNQITERLYIADRKHAGNHELYEQHAVDHVIQLTFAEPDEGYPGTVIVYTYCRLNSRLPTPPSCYCRPKYGPSSLEGQRPPLDCDS